MNPMNPTIPMNTTNRIDRMDISTDPLADHHVDKQKTVSICTVYNPSRSQPITGHSFLHSVTSVVCNPAHGGYVIRCAMKEYDRQEKEAMRKMDMKKQFEIDFRKLIEY